MLDHDVLQVLGGFANVHAFDGLSRLTSVLMGVKTGEEKKKNPTSNQNGKLTNYIPQGNTAAQNVKFFSLLIQRCPKKSSQQLVGSYTMME